MESVCVLYGVDTIGWGGFKIQCRALSKGGGALKKYQYKGGGPQKKMQNGEISSTPPPLPGHK